MAKIDEELTPEEEARAVLRFALPNLPASIRAAMLADPAVVTRAGFPLGEFLPLWGRSFGRADILTALRAIANGESVLLRSYDGKIEVTDGGPVDEHHAYLAVGHQRSIFANVSLLGRDGAKRNAALDAIAAQGEMSSDREAVWRAASAAGPFDDALYAALETELGSSPESFFGALVEQVERGEANFEDMVPADLNHFAGLLALFPPPASLAEFRAAWLAAAAILDDNRLLRLLKLCGPLSVVPGALVATASDKLPPETRVELTKFLAASADPLSQVAAFEILCRHLKTPGMREIGEELVGRLLDPAAALVSQWGPMLSAVLAATSVLEARTTCLAGWPLYAKRLVRFLHASHLLRAFEEAEVDIATAAQNMSRAFDSRAQLVDLSDAWIAAPFEPFYLGPIYLRVMLMHRCAAAITALDADERPAPWIEAGSRVLAADVADTGGFVHKIPGPFDAFEAEPISLRLCEPQEAQDLLGHLERADDAASAVELLTRFWIAQEAPEDMRSPVGAALPPFLDNLADDRQWLIAAEIGLRLASRWRDVALADAIIKRLTARAHEGRLNDHGAPPRLVLLGAAVVGDREAWRARVGDIALELAFALPHGMASLNMMLGLEFLRDLDPGLAGPLAASRSYAALANEGIPAQCEPTEAVSGIDETDEMTV